VSEGGKKTKKGEPAKKSIRGKSGETYPTHCATSWLFPKGEEKKRGKNGGNKRKE